MKNHEGMEMDRREFLGTTLAGGLGCLAVPALGSHRKGGEKAYKRITIVLTGGASHVDVWDLKPEAPRDIRGPFRPIATSMRGVEISEHLPRVAGLMHQGTLFRGMMERGPAIHGLEGYQGLIENSIELFPGPSSPEFSAGERLVLKKFSREEQERYGEHAFGKNLLLAYHLVEELGANVTVHFSAGLLNALSWDMHANGGDLAVDFRDMAWKLMPQLDQGLAALLTDLEGSGLIGETVVAVVSDMGRTPVINLRGGRDHHKGAWSNFAAGGPFLGGGVVGESDSLGMCVVSGGMTPREFCGLVS